MKAWSDTAFLHVMAIQPAPELEAKCMEARIITAIADRMLAQLRGAEPSEIARHYSRSGVPVYRWPLEDTGAIVYAVGISAYRDLDEEFHRAREMGKKLGSRLDCTGTLLTRTRRALIGAGVAAAAGWGVVAWMVCR